jgi:hypothetical protein
MFEQAWVLDEVQPLFPVPSCVLFAKHGSGEGPVLPGEVMAANGILPKRDASPAEAKLALQWQVVSWPHEANDGKSSAYKEQFLNGATIFPRFLSVVELASVGQLGANKAAPVVESRRTSQEKQPWKSLNAMRGNIEAEFLRPLYLGESIAPYRALGPELAVIPCEQNGALLNGETARIKGYVHLAKWMDQAEQIWSQNSNSKMTLIDQLDYYGKLSAQFPIAPLRVVFAASGTLPSASLLCDQQGIVEHALYWAKVKTQTEGHYLLGVLNSEAARKLAENLQARGQWGARHFDKVILSLPIPKFEPNNPLHKALAKAAAKAEAFASAVKLDDNMHFVKARQKIRAALAENGVAVEIDQLVAQLLGM